MKTIPPAVIAIVEKFTIPNKSGPPLYDGIKLDVSHAESGPSIINITVIGKDLDLSPLLVNLPNELQLVSAKTSFSGPKSTSVTVTITYQIV